MAQRSPLPNQSYLHECFNYCVETGVLTWKTRPHAHFDSVPTFRWWNTRYDGRVAGYLHSDGYRQIGIDGVYYKASRVIWKMIKNEEPWEIDHKNKQRHDNSWSNLRAATRSQNQGNVALRKDNSTGLKGACLIKSTGRFKANISISGKMVHLGTYADAEGAHAAYCKAARAHFGEFWCDGKST